MSKFNRGLSPEFMHQSDEEAKKTHGGPMSPWYPVTSPAR